MGGEEAILVGVRLRPFVSYEVGQPKCFNVSGNSVSVVGDVASDKETFQSHHQYPQPHRRRSEFLFDYAMDSTDPSRPDYVSQEKCYTLMASRMVGHAISGYHTCLFCYGQTGSGKTTTILGRSKPESEQGTLLRVFGDFFQQVHALEGRGSQVHCRLQILEVHKEKIRDLLPNPNAASTKTPEVHVHPRVGVWVDGATDNQVSSFEDSLALVEQARSRCTTASTAMNSMSSRAHTIFRLAVERHGEDHTVVSSEIVVVDLAGRENEKTTKVVGEHFIELSFINRSLMWLANCIEGLGQKQARSRRNSMEDGTVPAQDAHTSSSRARFRNSKLTLLLSNALTGNCKTSMIATVSPAKSSLDESYSTLQFATTVKGIKVQAKAAAKIDKDGLIQNLQEELRLLKDQMNVATPQSAQDIGDQVGLINNMMDSYQARWVEAQKNNEELRRQKDEALNNLAVSRWKFAKAETKLQKAEEQLVAGSHTLRLQSLEEDSPAREALCEPIGTSLQTQEQRLQEQRQNLALRERALLAREQAVEARERALAYANRLPPERARGIRGSPRGSRPDPAWLLKQPWQGGGTVAAWPDLPSLVIYSKDPNFSGRLVFHPAEPGREYMLGSAGSCEFKLPDVDGVGSETCVLYQDQGRLFLRPLGIVLLPSATIEVNGVRLVRTEPKELFHQDFVAIGHSFRFFVFTKPDEGMRALLLAEVPSDKAGPESSKASVIRGIIGEKRASLPLEMENAERYVSILQSQNHFGNSVAGIKEFLIAAHRATKLVEEAEAITAAVKPHGQATLRFSLVSSAPVLALGCVSTGCPELRVRLTREEPGQKLPDEVAHWDLARFEAKLLLMRKAYTAWSADPLGWCQDPLSNPWLDFNSHGAVNDFQQKQDELERLRDRLSVIKSLANGVPQVDASPRPSPRRVLGSVYSPTATAFSAQPSTPLTASGRSRTAWHHTSIPTVPPSPAQASAIPISPVMTSPRSVVVSLPPQVNNAYVSLASAARTLRAA
eukprot:TRINITY_DN91857_c0_g1_i1.p1 TRINITY_DN91857_c0_g1~~TRINITY_DN91857_c0_g1_i1.p1  ORF type:complete len:1022 (-),score=176.73 TRINITY_DN91857_c0_g1_i1:47-3064(-)